MGQYHNFHYGLRRDRGKASQYECSVPGCGKRAAEWAWDHGGDVVSEDVESFGGIRTLRYSLDQSHYVPLCKSCHVSFDQIKDTLRFPCGHPRSDENTYSRTGRSSYCRECHRAQERVRHHVKRSGRAAAG